MFDEFPPRRRERKADRVSVAQLLTLQPNPTILEMVGRFFTYRNAYSAPPASDCPAKFLEYHKVGVIFSSVFLRIGFTRWQPFCHHHKQVNQLKAGEVC